MSETGMERLQYKPTGLQQMRVLRILGESSATDIRCRLETRQQPETHEGSNYRALSYRCGDPKPITNITINGKHFGLAKNLLAYLQCEVKRPKKANSRLEMMPFWIDAVCINQYDDEEKSDQVHQM